MNREYYDAITKMEAQQTNKDFVNGWASGYIGNPPLEQQRRTEAYLAGYSAGAARTLDGIDNWTNGDIS
jgi:hypothetical protein